MQRDGNLDHTLWCQRYGSIRNNWFWTLCCRTKKQKMCVVCENSSVCDHHLRLSDAPRKLRACSGVRNVIYRFSSAPSIWVPIVLCRLSVAFISCCAICHKHKRTMSTHQNRERGWEADTWLLDQQCVPTQSSSRANWNGNYEMTKNKRKW